MDYSRNKVNEAGKALIKKSSKLSEDDAFNMLTYFRSIHVKPMSNFRFLLDRKIKGIKKENIALVSQRLKRKNSIVFKLKIQKNMALSRMQDIAGLRVILNNINDVSKLRNEIRNSEKEVAFKSVFVKEDDYIAIPKESGYRSIHLVYKYCKKVPEDKICFIEIQLRTQIMHAWATAVEVMGIYYNQPLKQSRGEQKFLDLFKDISKAFYFLENNKDDIKFYKKIIEDIEAFNFLDIFKGVRVGVKHIEQEGKGNYYYLLTLYPKESRVSINFFSKKDFSFANERYALLEKKYKDTKNEVVLVSVNNIKKLKQLYPNYFLDTTKFIDYLNEIKEKIKK